MKNNELLNNISNKIGLSQLDEHESLTFLTRNYNVKPSHIIIIFLLIILFIIIITDGTGFIASIACFLLPALQCLEYIAN
jgi:hypothetical protein